MNKYTKILILIAFWAINVPTLVNAQAFPSNYSTHEVPSSVTFCGKSIDLTRYDRYERMDRELLAFTYMHSTSIQMIKKANRYFPIVEPILKANGIPDDFKYLMVIESNLNPNARSGAGAAGLWQFMQTTGREYGLEVNKNIDDLKSGTHNSKSDNYIIPILRLKKR